MSRCLRQHGGKSFPSAVPLHDLVAPRCAPCVPCVWTPALTALSCQDPQSTVRPRTGEINGLPVLPEDHYEHLKERNEPYYPLFNAKDAIQCLNDKFVDRKTSMEMYQMFNWNPNPLEVKVTHPCASPVPPLCSPYAPCAIYPSRPESIEATDECASPFKYSKPQTQGQQGRLGALWEPSAEPPHRAPSCP